MVQFAKTFRIVSGTGIVAGCFAQSFQQKLWVLRYLTRDNDLTVRNGMSASHRAERGARPTRRDEGEYREYSTEEQRSPAGCIARRMQRAYRFGLFKGARGIS